MRILDRGQISKSGTDKNFNSNTFPNIVKLPSGRWLAGFYAAEKKIDPLYYHAVMTWSDDEGKSWVRPFEPVKLPDLRGVPGFSRCLYFLPLGGKRVLMVINWVDASDVTKPYYNPENESLKDTKIFYCFTEDDGETWSQPQLMNTAPIYAPVPLTGAPFLLEDNTMVCHFEVNKSETDPTKWIHRSCFIYSQDGGETWGDVVKITEIPDMFYWDQRPNVLADGKTVLNYFWTFDGKKQEYLNIHAAISEDKGKTWSGIWDTGIYGQPGSPADLLDGRIAAIDIDRSVRPVITVRISRDRGRTYDESIIVYDNELYQQDSKSMNMNEAWDEMGRFSVGHPCLLWLGNGELLAYFYAGEHSDNTHIEFVRIAVDEAAERRRLR